MQKLLLTLMAACFAIVCHCQNKTVTGRVTDEKEEPLPFATIKIKGAATTVTTDENGLFKISVPLNAILQISYIGATSKEVEVGSQTNLAINLTRNNNDLLP